MVCAYRLNFIWISVLCWNIAISTKFSHFRRGGCAHPPFWPGSNLTGNSRPTVYASLTHQMSFESVYCVTFQGQKTQFSAKFDIWGSCTQPPLLMKAKFDVLEQTYGLRLFAKLRFDRFILSPSGSEKRQLLPFLVLRRFVMSSTGGIWRKLNVTKPQTFPYPTVSKFFPYSSVFKAKSCHQFHRSQGRGSQAWWKTKQTRNSTFLVAVAACEIRGPRNSAWW